MTGLLFLCLYLCCGCLIIRSLLPGHRPVNRIWLGLSLGLLLLMWLPALCAFGLDFTMKAHWVSLLPLILATSGCYFLRDKRPLKPWDRQETSLVITFAAVVLPLTLLSAWLQYSHNLRPTAYGGLHVGQSTYGDLSMHVSFITSLVNMPFPPQYSFYPGHQLSYPFLTDSLSTSFYLMGWSLQAAMDIPGTLMMCLCYMGVLVLARDMTAGKKAMVLAMLLFFLNGGLGFLYDFDLAGGFEDGSLTAWNRIQNILNGYYMTPTNQPDPNNLRWSNVIADLMLPQRTLLGGWTMVIPCFYLLFNGFAPGHRQEKGGLRSDLLLGVWGGSLPLIHTHTFLALVLASFGFFLYDILHEKEKAAAFLRYLRYAAVAAVLCLPQLILFTFPQTFQAAGAEGSGNSFIVFHWNWANNRGDYGMRDMYLWFYIKNIGLPFIALLLALLEKNPAHRRTFSAAGMIILVAELVRFQPNEYDNNKLLYLAWLLCCMITADWFLMMWQRLKGLRARPVVAASAAVMMFLSAGLTLWREAVSDYQAYSPGAVEAGEYIRENTPEHCTFMTGIQHLNPVCTLAGRNIICGSDLYLYFHGFNTTARKEDIRRFYTDPAGNLDVIDKYNIDYIYVSSYEQADYPVDLEIMDELFIRVFENREAVIYALEVG